MKASELRKKNKTELNKILLKRREKLCQLRFDLGQAKLKDTTQIKKTKKDIARILTILCQEKH